MGTPTYISYDNTQEQLLLYNKIRNVKSKNGSSEPQVMLLETFKKNRPNKVPSAAAKR